MEVKLSSFKDDEEADVARDDEAVDELGGEELGGINTGAADDPIDDKT